MKEAGQETQSAGDPTPRIERGLVQIAGVLDSAEAELLTECGVDFLGFPFRLSVHREDISQQLASRIIARLTPPTFGVLITYLDRASQIGALCDVLGVGIVQLHGPIHTAELARLKALVPDLVVIKSLVVVPGPNRHLDSLLDQTWALVDAYITDTFDPQTGASGATGKTHDWQVSRHLVEVSPKPVILAGGLTPDNVAEAIHTVEPAGVDAHSGVEGPDGRKRRDSVCRFVREAKQAFRKAEPNCGDVPP